MRPIARPNRNPRLFDRLGLWLSSGKDIDGLWAGVEIGEPETALQRVEDALRLIKQHSPLHYSRVVHNLKRVWVHLVPHGSGCYDASLDACELDPRFVLTETTTLEEIASAIVHEATHARLDRWGISYDEDKRPRIEAICRRRELNFLKGLPNGEPYREWIVQTLKSPVDGHDHFSDANFQQRIHDGHVESLRYLGTPEWFVHLLLKVLELHRGFQRFVRALRTT
jgi:hypothetical protein